MHNHHEREQWDYETGMASEQQNAFALSSMERRIRNDYPRAVELARSGRYVLMSDGEICCRFTDAVVGYDRILVGDYATPEEALAACLEDEGSYILGPEQVVPKPPADYLPADCGECPF